MPLLALTSSAGLSLWNCTPTTDSPLSLAASAPIPCRSVVWRADGSQFLTLSDEAVEVWSREGKQLYEVHRTDPDASVPATNALFLGSSLVLSSRGAAHVYSSNGALATSLTGHSPNSPLTSLSANCDNTLFASASSAASLILYNRTTNTQYSLGVKPKAPYSVIQFAPTRRTFLAAATTTGLLHLFDTTKPSAPIRTISLSPSPLPSAITNLAFSPVGPLLLACTATGSLSLIDTEKCKVVVSHEVGVEVEKGRMALAPDGRTAVLAGKGVVRVLDIKTRKGVKEIAIKEGARLGGLAFQPGPTKSKSSTAPSSPTKPASSILTESINRMRAAHRSLSPTKEPQTKKAAPIPSRMLTDIEEVLSPLQFGGGKTVHLEMEGEELPTRAVFADSIRREARTSTIRSTDLASSLTDAPSRLSNSMSHSLNIPSSCSSRLPATTTFRASSRQSQSQDQNLPPSMTTSYRKESHSPALHTLNASSRASPALSTTTTIRSNETIGAVTSKLRLPELEGSVGRDREREKDTSCFEYHLEEGDEEEEENRTPVPTKGNGKGKGRRVGFQEENGIGGAAKRVVTPRVRKSVEVAEDEEEEEEERSVGGGGNVDEAQLLKAAVRDVMEEYHAKSSREIQNLHLELIRQTFSQKTEMKALLAHYLGGELKQLREENARLREENARLRRGY